MFDPRAYRRFRKNRGALLGVVVVALLVVFALIGPVFSGHDPNASDFATGRDADGRAIGSSPMH